MLEKLLQTEPARFIGILTALVGLAVGAGLMTQARADAWVLLAGALLPVLLPLLQQYFTRNRVFSPDTVQKLADQATYLPAGTTVDIGKPPDASPPLPAGG